MPRITIFFILPSLALAFMAAALSCGDANPKATFDPDGGHPSGWVGSHGAAFLSGPEQCSKCHGSDLLGGVSGLSCFSPGFEGASCHGAPAFHGAGWPEPGVHGPDTKAEPEGVKGFASCKACHGGDFAGGAIRISCFTAACHGVPAPHSPAPWSTPITAGTHTDTNSLNAPVCAECHRDESGAGVPPATPAGCFNNTLCHAILTPHPTGWAEPGLHGAAAKAAPGLETGFAACRSCHGADFAGGTVESSCFGAGCHTAPAPHSAAPWRTPVTTGTHTDTDGRNAAVCAECHRDESGAGVPPATPAGCFNNTLCHGVLGVPHAVPFTDPADHGPAAKADLTFCQTCHAEPSDGGPGSNPRFNVSTGGLSTGCEAGACHDPLTAHPAPWEGPDETGHQSAGNLATACALCHGAALEGGVGPACSECHTAGSPLSLENCTSCHDIPPSGTVRPDTEGAHFEHDALNGVTGICGACHGGAGSGTLQHFDSTPPADVAVLSAYDAKSGFAAFDAGRCSFVSCHGGPRTQTETQARRNPPESTPFLTPDWSGGIDVDTGCSACHVLGASEGSPEFNSYFSGEHEKHFVGEGVFCTVCHDAAKLKVNHFTALDTPQMEGPASATISDNVRYNINATPPTCNPDEGGISGCHGQKDW